MNQFDYLIIGQGLAGTLLAWELEQHGKSFLIVDNDKPNASKVAAGLINPITGMRLVKNENIDFLLKKAKNYYFVLEKYFGESFFIELPMLRILQNENELTLAEKRLSQSEYSSYVRALNNEIDGINSSYGILKQTQTAILNIPKLLKVLKKYFIEKNSYEQTNFDSSDISFLEKIHWNGKEFNHIIFCQGYEASNNIYFDWLPLKPVKGEILTINIESTEIIQNHIMNYGYWLIPTENNRFRTGATFDRGNIDTQITDVAKNTLLQALMDNIQDMDKAIVVDHKAGIRPTTIDREPVIGSHPLHSNISIFNGFGTKGGLYIPYYSQVLIEYLLYNKSIPHAVNIKRFINEYFTD